MKFKLLKKQEYNKLLDRIWALECLVIPLAPFKRDERVKLYPEGKKFDAKTGEPIESSIHTILQVKVVGTAYHYKLTCKGWNHVWAEEHELEKAD